MAYITLCEVMCWRPSDGMLPGCLNKDWVTHRAGYPARNEGQNMAIGPVQLIVLGFSHPDFHGEIIAELKRLRESGTVL